MGKTFKTIDEAVIRFAGDSGDGMQLTGGRFTETTAIVGNDLSTLPSHQKGEQGQLSRSCQFFLLATKGKPLIPKPGLYDPRLEKAVVRLRSNASHLLGTFRRRTRLQPNNHCVFCHQPNGDLKHLLRDCVSFSDHRPDKVPNGLFKPSGRVRICKTYRCGC